MQNNVIDIIRTKASVDLPRVFSWVLGVLPLFIGTMAIACAFIPFDFLYARARHIATGQMTLVTRQFYWHMQRRFLTIGFASITTSGGLLLFRTKLSQYLSGMSEDVRNLRASAIFFAKSIPSYQLVLVSYYVVLAAFIRVPFLIYQPMRYDEATTFSEFASHPLYYALSIYSAPNNHLLHTFMVHWSYLLFGNHPWAIRLPAFIAGLLLIPASYVVAYILYGDGAATATAALVACSATLSDYSTNARGYTIICLLFMVLVPIATYALHNHNSTAWYLLALLAALGMYTIPIMLYPVAGTVVWLLLSSANRGTSERIRVLKGIAGTTSAATVITLALYSPALAVSGPLLIFANSYVTPRPFLMFAHELPHSLYSTWKSWNVGLPVLISGLLVLGCVISSLSRRCSPFAVPMLVAQGVALVPLLLIQRVVPFERVWLFALPLYFVASSGGLAFAARMTPSRFQPRIALTVLAIVAPLWLCIETRSTNATARNEGSGMEAVAGALKSRLKPGDAVVSGALSEPILKYYLRKNGVEGTHVGPTSSTHMFVVVNGLAGETLQTVLRSRDVSPSLAQSANLVGRYDSISIYEVFESGATCKTVKNSLKGRSHQWARAHGISNEGIKMGHVNHKMATICVLFAEYQIISLAV